MKYKIKKEDIIKIIEETEKTNIKILEEIYSNSGDKEKREDFITKLKIYTKFIKMNIERFYLNKQTIKLEDYYHHIPINSLSNLIEFYCTQCKKHTFMRKENGTAICPICSKKHKI